MPPLAPEIRQAKGAGRHFATPSMCRQRNPSRFAEATTDRCIQKPACWPRLSGLVTAECFAISSIRSANQFPFTIAYAGATPWNKRHPPILFQQASDDFQSRLRAALRDLLGGLLPLNNRMDFARFLDYITHKRSKRGRRRSHLHPLHFMKIREPSPPSECLDRERFEHLLRRHAVWHFR